jgi:hypothetical protein
MARTLPGGVSTDIAQKLVEPFFAVDIDFVSGPLYVWSGVGDIVNASKTYLGAGQLMSLSTISETAEVEAKGVSITMTGIPSSFLSLALSEPYQGVACRVYFGTINTSTRVATFYKVFAGSLDQMNIVENVESATILISVENSLIKLDRPVVRRYTDQDQKSRYPSDRGLEYVASLQDKTLYWGQPSK